MKQFFETMGEMRQLMDKISAVPNEEKTATFLQLRALSFLKLHPGATMSELATSLSMSSSSVAQFVQRLTLAQTVKRVHDKEDRRVVRLSLTHHGEQALGELRIKVMEKMSTVMELVPEADLEELVRINTELVTKMKGKYTSYETR